jgi:hypothetical protein
MSFFKNTAGYGLNFSEKTIDGSTVDIGGSGGSGGSGTFTDITVSGDTTLNGELILSPTTDIQWNPTNRNYIINEDLPKSITTGTDNVAMGKHSLHQVTTGVHNIGFGHQAGRYITTGGDNIAIGKLALSAVGATTVNTNIAIGTNSLLSASTVGVAPIGNVAVGYDSGKNNTTGRFNVYLGRESGASSTFVSRSTALGYQADCANFDDSTALGAQTVCTAANQIRLGKSSQNVSCPGTLSFRMASDNNNGTYYIPFSKVAGGTEGALFVDDTTGPLSYNPSTSTLTSAYTNLSQGVVNPDTTLRNYFWTDRTTRPTGGNNICIGYWAGNILNTSSENVLIGSEAGRQASTGNRNCYLGYRTSNGSNANNCVSIGYDANQGNTHGSNCVAIGSLSSCSTFQSCVALGAGSTCTGDNQIRLGTSSQTVSCPGPVIVDGRISTSITSAPSSARHLGYIVNQSTAGWTTSLTSNTQTNITSVAFTSADYGTYLFEAKIQITPVDNTVARQQILGISTASANYGNNTDLQYTMANVGHPMLSVMRVLNIYANTTVYLVGYIAGTNGTVNTVSSAGIFSYTRIA